MWWNKKKLEEVAPIAEEITVYQEAGIEHLMAKVEAEKKQKHQQELQQKRAQRKKEREEKKLREQIEADKEYIKFCMRRLMQEFPNWDIEKIVLSSLFKKYNPLYSTISNYPQLGAWYSNGNIVQTQCPGILITSSSLNLSAKILRDIYYEVISDRLNSINEEWEKRVV